MSAAGTGAACSPNSNRTSVTTGIDCIAEQTRVTRGRIAADCFANPKALVPGATYVPSECHGGGIQAEAIAQARAIVQLNHAGVYGDVAVGNAAVPAISANLQWETAIPRGRPDLVLYDRTKANAPIGVVEMKLTTQVGGTGQKKAEEELAAYLTNFPTTVGGRAVQAYDFSKKPFLDSFVVTLSACTRASDKQREIRYTTTSPVPGILMVDGTKIGCSDRRPSSENEYRGTIGADADHNSRDDFIDWLIQHPALLTIDIARLPKVFIPLSQPVRVVLGEEEIEAIETGLSSGEEAAWAKIVAGLPDLAAKAEGLIAADDAAGLGMTAAELEVAGTALEAGFVTLPVLLVGVAVAAAVVGTIWALHQWNAFGDPHLATLDGLSYDLQAVGEFHLVKVPSQHIDVQARFSPVGSARTWSSTAALAMTVNGHLVDLRPDGTVQIDYQVLSDHTSVVDLGAGAGVLRKGTQMVVQFPGTDGPSVMLDGTRISFRVAPGVPTTGLLGNNDGLTTSDLQMPDGTTIDATNASIVHGTYANAWRITDADSEFSYEEEEDTTSFTDLSFPANVVTLGDFSQIDLDKATQVCLSRHVNAGPQLDACELDVASTGDASYATEAAAVTNFLQSPTARSVDAAGTVTETFDGAIAPNFRPSSLRTLEHGTGAGPIFDTGGYQFSVPDLPNHTTATVAFTLYVFGLTATPVEPASATLSVQEGGTSTLSFTSTSARVTSGTATLSTARTGTIGTTAFTAYRVTLTVPHYDPQLRVSVQPSGFRGLIGTSLALDDLSASLTLEKPQTFGLTLPGTVSPGVVNGAAAAGAGTLENRASADVYTFTVPAGGQNLNLAASACPASYWLSWTLSGPTGTTVKSGSCSFTALGQLPAGTYQLTVTPESGHTGTYALDVRSPQTFTVSTPLSVTNATINGANAPGAGNLELPDSADVYTFTVPAGGQNLNLAASACPASYWLSWTLSGPTGTTVKSGSCSFTALGQLPAGTYQLTVTPESGHTGTYALDVRQATTPAQVG